MKYLRRTIKKKSKNNKSLKKYNTKKYNKKYNTKRYNNKKYNKKILKKKTKKLKGGGIIPQGLVNLYRGGQDFMHNTYSDITGGNTSWSNSNPTHQYELVKPNTSQYKMANIQQLSEAADIQVNKFLN